jgi:Predicted membrane protein
MYRKANFGLIVLAVLFLATLYFHLRFADSRGVHFLFFAVESALVATLADWYAVSALFTRPLGIKWHTDLLGRNRANLTKGIVGMVESELLPKATLLSHVRDIHFVNIGMEWLESHLAANKTTVGEKVWVALRQLLLSLDIDKSSAFIEQKLKEALKSANVSSLAGEAIRWSTREGHLDRLLDHLVGFARERLHGTHTRSAIRDLLESERRKYVNKGNFFKRQAKKFMESMAEKTGVLDLDDAADALYREIVELVKSLEDRNHDLRLLVKDALERIGDDLQSGMTLSTGEINPIRRAVDEWKNDAIHRVSFQPVISQILNAFIAYMNRDEPIKYWDRELRTSDIKAWTIDFVNRYWDRFRQDEMKKDALNQYARQLIVHVVEKEYHRIGQIVHKTLESFTDERLKQLVKDKVGEDLQAIRLNGAVVGAIIGCVLFLVLHFVYDPILQLLGNG